VEKDENRHFIAGFDVFRGFGAGGKAGRPESKFHKSVGTTGESKFILKTAPKTGTFWRFLSEICSKKCIFGRGFRQTYVDFMDNFPRIE
jgi:hypothetical protein